MRRASFLPLLLAGLAPACRSAESLRVEPVAANPADSFPGSADPALAADPATGDLLLAFVAGTDSAGWQLYFTRSADRGATWAPVVPVTSDPHEVHPHGEASPRLVAGSGGRVALVWPQSIKVPGRKWPANRMRFARSLDGGATWGPPVTINDDTTGALIAHTFQGATWVGDSGLMAAWLDERGRGTEGSGGAEQHNHADTSESDSRVYAVSSTDFGDSWGANRELWRAACPCCRVSLARKPDGTPLAAWRRHYPGNVRDIVVAPVSAAGAEPVRVREDNWVYPGCPHTGPALSLDRSGVAHVAWYTGKEGAAGVFLARDAADLRFTDPVALVRGDRLPTAHPAVAALEDGGSLVAWDIDGTGARWLAVASVGPGDWQADPVTVPGTEGATYPQLASLGRGQAVVAWTQLVNDTLRLGLAEIRSR